MNKMPRNTSFTNEDLILFSKEGNEAAFDRLFNQFYAPLCYFASNIVKDSYTSEDIVQDILLKSWQQHAKFDKFTTLRAFLYTSVRNACFDYLDHQKVKNRHEGHIAASLENRERDALYLLMQTELTRQLFAVVDTLPEQCRKVIRLTFEQGLKPVEIAEQLGIAVSTVNNQKMRGLKLLKDRLSDEDLGIALSLFVFLQLTQL